MKSRHCPRCQQHTLVPTGAFWACGTCVYAITQAALLVEHAMRELHDRQESGGIHALDRIKA